MIDLYTAATPNGYKASVMLEEVGLPYEVHALNLGAGEQKQDWFLKINPNGRVPAIVDRDEDNFAVFESGAVLLYLAEKTGKLLPSDRKGRSIVTQWLMFQMGGIGPMMGQANVFFRYWHESYQPAIDRYQNESRRLLTVLNTRLKDHEYLASDYSVADIASWCWARGYAWGGISIDGLEHLQRWITAIGDRPAVQRGVQVPKRIEASTDEERNKQIETARTMVQR